MYKIIESTEDFNDCVTKYCMQLETEKTEKVLPLWTEEVVFPLSSFAAMLYKNYPALESFTCGYNHVMANKILEEVWLDGK